MSLRTRRGLGLWASLLLVVVACSSGTPTTAPTTAPVTTLPTGGITPPGSTPGTSPVVIPSSGASSAPGTPGTSSAPGTPGATGQKLIYVIDGEITYLTNASNDVPTANAIQFLYDALYQYDQNLKPVPNLTTEPATISADGKTLTIKLQKNVVFQPTGTPMTADDVVFTYKMANSPACRFNPSICLSTVKVDDGTGKQVPVLKDVKKIDDFTVEFDLGGKYAPFLTLILPGIAIDSKAAVEASYAKFQQNASAVTSADVKKVVDDLAAEAKNPTGPPDPADPSAGPTVNNVKFRAAIEDILNRAKIQLPDPAQFPATDAAGKPTGQLDEAAYVAAEIKLLNNLQAALIASATDQLAAAYTLLDISRKPVGTGPWYLTDFQPGLSLTLTANDKYFKGAPKLSTIYLQIIKESTAAAAALGAGQVDWQYQLTADAYASVKDNPNVKFAEYNDFGWFGLFFNLREGAMFADKRLRQAASYCFDKEATVKAATNGLATTINGDIPPPSWAYNPNVTKYPLDVAKGKQLIADAGYTIGADGIAEKGGKKLSTTILVRKGKPDRIKFMQLWAQQVKDCGLDMKIQEADFATVLLPMINDWPLTNPATGKPFDAYFGGFGTSLDPDPFSNFHSSQVVTKDPNSFGRYNFQGFVNKEADKLIEQGQTELDQAKRATIYQKFEQLLSDEVPIIFAWADIRHDGLAKTVNGAEPWTQANMNTPTWFWQLEKITNSKGAAQ